MLDTGANLYDSLKYFKTFASTFYALKFDLVQIYFRLKFGLTSKMNNSFKCPHTFSAL